MVARTLDRVERAGARGGTDTRAGRQRAARSDRVAPGTRHSSRGVRALAQTAGVSAYRAVLWDALGLIVLVVAAITALLAVGPVGSAASARATRLRPVLFAVALCFGAPAVLFLLSWITTPVYTARYLSWVSIGSALIVGAAVFTVTVRRRVLSALAGVCAVILLAVAGWVTAQQLAEPPGLYDDAPSLVRELDAGAEVGDALAVIQRNPHSGVAYSVARNIGSDTWAADVADPLRQSAQPVVEVRSITGTGPLSVASAPPTGSRDDEMSIWVISLDPPSNAELARISTDSGAEPMQPAPTRRCSEGCGSTNSVARERGQNPTIEVRVGRHHLGIREQAGSRQRGGGDPGAQAGIRGEAMQSPAQRRPVARYHADAIALVLDPLGRSALIGDDGRHPRRQVLQDVLS